MKYQNYKDLESLKETLVGQGSKVTFVFPDSITDKEYEEWLNGPSKMKPSCGCTSYTMQPEFNQVTFVVEAPVLNVEVSEPFLKSINPTMTTRYGKKEWDIKFYVNNKK